MQTIGFVAAILGKTGTSADLQPVRADTSARCLILPGFYLQCHAVDVFLLHQVLGKQYQGVHFTMTCVVFVAAANALHLQTHSLFCMQAKADTDCRPKLCGHKLAA